MLRILFYRSYVLNDPHSNPSPWVGRGVGVRAIVRITSRFIKATGQIEFNLLVVDWRECNTIASREFGVECLETCNRRVDLLAGFGISFSQFGISAK
jgi:hypothetical protein